MARLMDTGENSPRAPLWRVRSWELWALPPWGRRFLLCVEALAALLSVGTLWIARPSEVQFARIALLLAIAAVYAETVAHFAKLRRWLGGDQVRADHLSVWTIAAAVLVPAGLAAMLVVIGFGYVVLRSGRVQGLKPHREVFAAATAVLGILAASAAYHAVIDSQPGNGAMRAAGMLIAVILSGGVSLVLLTTGIVLVTRPPTLRPVLPSGDVIAFEIATLIIGVITAELVQKSVWLTPVVLVPLGVLQRSTMVTLLEARVGIDDKTGLLNAGAWRQMAERLLDRSRRDGKPAALLLIDLDHFKLVNDTHGHLAGDDALRATADCLRSDLRGYDAVGRYGGEEFVVQLPGVDRDSATAIAQRLVERIRDLSLADDLRLTASIGLAVFPDVGSTLDELIAAADVALYAAKQGGRNQVQIATAPAHVPMRTAS